MENIKIPKGGITKPYFDEYLVKGFKGIENIVQGKSSLSGLDEFDMYIAQIEMFLYSYYSFKTEHILNEMSREKDFKSLKEKMKWEVNNYETVLEKVKYEVMERGFELLDKTK